MRGLTQLKVQIKTWADESGKWREFVNAREALKKKGVAPSAAWMLAAQEIDPVMWGSAAPEHLAGRLADMQKLSESNEQVEATDVSTVAPATGQVAQSVIASAMEAIEVEGSATVKLFAGKRVATAKVVEWVASMIQVSDVKPKDAPSSEAWGMLVWARRSPVNESQFWGTIYGKLLPSRAQIDSELKYADDGMRVEETADRLLAMREAFEADSETHPAHSATEGARRGIEEDDGA